MHFFFGLFNWRRSEPGCMIELGLTDCVLFFFFLFSILVRLRMRSTPKGIGRERRGRRRSKGVSDGSVPALFLSCRFRYTRHRRKRRLISLMSLIFVL